MADKTFSLDEMRITEKRKDLLQLVYEHPGHSGVQWYAERVDMSPENIYHAHRTHPDLFDTEAAGDSAGSKRWRLSDEAIEHLRAEGVLEPDEFADFEHEAEEPSQTVERGNVTITGGLDFTDAEGGEQIWQDRPVKQDTGGGPVPVGAPESSPAVNGASDEDVSESVAGVESEPSAEERHTVELTDADVFDIVRNASEETARRVYDETRGNAPVGEESD